MTPVVKTECIFTCQNELQPGNLDKLLHIAKLSQAAKIYNFFENPHLLFRTNLELFQIRC